MELLLVTLVPSVVVIVWDGVVFSMKPELVKVCVPLSPLTNVYLLPEVLGRTAAESEDVK